MSVLYPQLTNTKFPNEVDTINNFVDITLTTLPLAKQYYAKYNAGDIVGANQILIDNPDLKYSYIGAASLNPIVDAIKAIELFYMQDVQKYLMNIVSYKGEWSASVKYSKYSTVQYVHNSAIEVFMCANNDTPIGTIPTDTTYWIPLTMRGERGLAGIGLSAYGGWNSITKYPVNAMVAYNNALWGSYEENTAITPTESSSSTWYKIIEFSSELLAFIDKKSETSYKLTIDNGLVYFDSKNSKIDLALKSDIPTSLPASGGNAATVNGKTVESNVPANAKFTDTVYTHPATHPYSMITGAPTSLPANGGNANYANYASNAGNSDSVDSLHFTLSTAIPTTLTSNYICYVYE